ncbi:MAG: hypothetical protein PHN69_01550 [Candidatus Pacebacteria bacterium]|nr:hypothetical protein [Candidatus Paceibacterota bacterium]
MILKNIKDKIINKVVFFKKDSFLKKSFFVKLFLILFLVLGFLNIAIKDVSADTNTPCSATCSQYSNNGNNITWKVSSAFGSCDNNSKKYYYKTGGSSTGNLFFTSATGLSNNTARTFSTPSNVGTVYARITTKNDGSTGWITCGSGSGSNSDSGIVSSNDSSYLTASCSPNKSSIEIGESVTWTVKASGPYTSYNYTWSGTESLQGNNSSVIGTYQYSGTKTASVTVKNYKTCSSCSKTITVSCGSVNVKDVEIDDLKVSCSANPNDIGIGESTTWTANASGGTGSYSYSWSGTNSLTGSSKTIGKTYTSEGIKSAIVTVTSGNKVGYANCSMNVRETPVNNLTVSCSANPSNIEIGESTTWLANASGGTGSYTYSWSGTNSLSGSSRTVNKLYSTEGEKTATVIVTSGNKTAYVNCSVYVEDEDDDDDLEVTCYADDDSVETGDSIKWIADVDGGSGSYSYSWSGTNSLTGSSKTVTKRYTSDGEKYAKIKVISGGQTEYATCYADVEEDEDEDDDLEVSCYADDDSVETGDSIKWIAEADGGSGSYKYSWSGTDGLDGSSRTVTERYSDEGEKKARVKVTSGGQTEYATCYADVDDDNQVLSYVQTNPVMPLAASVYLSDVPYTGAGDNIKIVLFATMLVLWSMFLAYYLLRKRMNSIQEVATVESNNIKSDSSFKVQDDFIQTVELDNKALTDIEDYARMNKVILSSSATEKILKLSRLGKAKANEVIKSLSTGEWIAVGEEEIK